VVAKSGFLLENNDNRRWMMNLKVPACMESAVDFKHNERRQTAGIIHTSNNGIVVGKWAKGG
jgi:hypothetical protein